VRLSARNRELFGLIPVALMVTAGFTAVLITQGEQDIEASSLLYGAIFLGACVLAHLFIRRRLPDADPYMFPLAALLSAFGLVMLYRMDEELARGQAIVFGISLAFFCITIIFLRDHRTLERYRYVIAVGGILLLLLPLAPVIGGQVNGAYLNIDLGFVQFQPAEFTKLAIIVFLASYLNDTREVLLGGGLAPPPLRRSLPFVAACLVLVGLLRFVLELEWWPSVLIAIFTAVLAALIRERPSLKHFGPLLLIWGLAMLMLIFIRDLGSSLMFFGAFLVILYVATARLSFVALGVTMFLGGATVLAGTLTHVQDRVAIWLDPFARDAPEGAGQITQSLFAQADGGLFGVGFGESLLKLSGPFATQGCETPFPNCNSILPAPHTDSIYAVIVNEVGLFGAAAVVFVALLFAARGFKAAMLAEDGFSKLLAVGLSSVFALQVFVIVGGVIKLIPLTGVTLPLVSFGGSSLVANFILLALLLIVSDHARRDAARRRPGGVV
jgi:cell division protein FtsW (lipid II flippase)